MFPILDAHHESNCKQDRAQSGQNEAKERIPASQPSGGGENDFLLSTEGLCRISCTRTVFFSWLVLTISYIYPKRQNNLAIDDPI